MSEIRVFASGERYGERVEIDDLYWFEEEGVHDWGGEGHVDRYNIEIYVDGLQVFPYSDLRTRLAAAERVRDEAREHLGVVLGYSLPEERDSLLAENRALLKAITALDAVYGRQAEQLAPITAAEVERVKGLENAEKYWTETAAQFARNVDFYRGLLDQTARHLGPSVFVSDDGSVQDEPIRLKIPELVQALEQSNRELREALIAAGKALELIGCERYTAQILWEDGASEEEQVRTWSHRCIEQANIARKARTAIGGGVWNAGRWVPEQTRAALSPAGEGGKS
jgi:hypothetical protein